METSGQNISPTARRRSSGNETRAIERFQPPANALYSIETTAQLVGLPRRTIGIYCKHGLVSSAVDPDNGGYYFNRRAIRDLRRIESLRSVCGDDLSGIKIILDLMEEIERLQFRVRSLMQ